MIATHITSRSRKRGFTLIEILVVVAIIIILVAAVIAIGSYVKQNGQRGLTKTTLKNLEGMLDEFKTLTDGNIPSSGENFANAFTKVPALQKQLGELPSGTVVIENSNTKVKDGFGNNIELVVQSAQFPRTGFRSKGPNGKGGDTDDIYSWEP